jgi:hypothetical protein
MALTDLKVLPMLRQSRQSQDATSHMATSFLLRVNVKSSQVHSFDAKLAEIFDQEDLVLNLFQGVDGFSTVSAVRILSSSPILEPNVGIAIEDSVQLLPLAVSPHLQGLLLQWQQITFSDVYLIQYRKTVSQASLSLLAHHVQQLYPLDQWSDSFALDQLEANFDNLGLWSIWDAPITTIGITKLVVASVIP